MIKEIIYKKKLYALIIKKGFKKKKVFLFLQKIVPISKLVT